MRERLANQREGTRPRAHRKSRQRSSQREGGIGDRSFQKCTPLLSPPYWTARAPVSTPSPLARGKIGSPTLRTQIGPKFGSVDLLIPPRRKETVSNWTTDPWVMRGILRHTPTHRDLQHSRKHSGFVSSLQDQVGLFRPQFLHTILHTRCYPL